MMILTGVWTRRRRRWLWWREETWMAGPFATHEELRSWMREQGIQDYRVVYLPSRGPVFVPVRAS